MPKSKSQEANIAHQDLTELANSKSFKRAVREAKGDISQGIDLCERFNIVNLTWMNHVIRTWNGKRPLPWGDDPSLKNPSHWSLGLYKDNRFATGYGFIGAEYSGLDRSPRLQKQKIFQVDELGSLWVTLRVRLRPDISAKEIGEWASRSIPKTKSRKTKPQLKSLGFTLLGQMKATKAVRTTYGKSQYLQGKFKDLGIELKFDTAKRYVMDYANPRKT